MQDDSFLQPFINFWLILFYAKINAIYVLHFLSFIDKNYDIIYFRTLLLFFLLGIYIGNHFIQPIIVFFNLFQGHIILIIWMFHYLFIQSSKGGHTDCFLIFLFQHCQLRCFLITSVIRIVQKEFERILAVFLCSVTN